MSKSRASKIPIFEGAAPGAIRTVLKQQMPHAVRRLDPGNIIEKNNTSRNNRTTANKK
jgi:hypothetical protein